MARSDVPTFVGPVTSEQILPRVYKVGFLILQAAKDCSPILLEYDDKETATKSREQLLTSTNTYRVPSNKLLYALQMALNQAQGG
jgi:hypothetical protein